MDQKINTSMLIFHNYRTPYRDVLFDRLSLKTSLTVAYLQKPSDENRNWKDALKSRYNIFQLSRIKIWKVFLNNLFLPKALRTETFDSVVFVDNLPNLLMMFFYTCFYFKKSHRILWTEDCNLGYHDSFLRKIVQKTLRNMILKNIDEVWFFSEKVDVYWHRNYPIKKSKILVQSPYTHSEISSIPEKQIIAGRRVFGYMGYFSERKGLFDLIEGVDALVKDNIPVKLKIAGDGELKKALKQKASNHIEIFNYLNKNEKSHFFSNIDFLVLPSYQDPWGMVINEAMAHGVIPIVSDETGAKEMVEGSGYIFTSGSVNSLINALLWGVRLTDAELTIISKKVTKESKRYTNDKNVAVIMEDN
jgi:glycosyltransferase involved in cell wall biosynthesis